MPGRATRRSPTPWAQSRPSGALTPRGPVRVLCIVVHGRRTQAVAEACRAAGAGRQDLVVIETDDPAVADAASVTADCLVSLHRSSAFGPDIARAISVGCPVVATGYGGPMDYLSGEWAELVPYEVAPIPPATYPFPAGTKWAEPDLEAAAAALRRVHGDFSEARRRAWQGRIAVSRLCGPKAAGRALRRRLDEPSVASGETRDRRRAGGVR